MAADKKITELPVLPSLPADSDIAILVRNDIDYQVTCGELKSAIAAAFDNGSHITFLNPTPTNDIGVNFDVNINFTTGEFTQKVAGVWTLFYTVPVATPGTIWYGNNPPSNLTGHDGDTYIQTDGGIFYKKADGIYTALFSMASGPAGATGADGADGAAGANGNTVLNGVIPPSNIDDGVNGDFYINTATEVIYGPKAAGIWPAGVSLIATAPNLKRAYTYDTTDPRFVYDSVNFTLTFLLSGTEQALFPFDAVAGILFPAFRQKTAANTYKTKNSLEPIIIDDGTKYISVMYEGVTPDLLTYGADTTDITKNSQIIIS